MFTITAAQPVNPPGTAPRLTAAQVWEGLELRARVLDERFTPPGHHFEVLADEEAGLTRRVQRAGQPEEVQRVTFHGDRVVVYDFVEGPQRSIILNAIETDDDGELALRFTYLIEYQDLVAGSAEERQAAEERRPAMTGQPGRVMQVIRALVAEGRIA